MLNKLSDELFGIFGLVLVAIISFVVAQVLSISFIWIFFAVAVIAWGGLHLREIQLLKEIDSKDDIIFDIKPDDVVLKRQKFDPPILAFMKENDGKEYQVEVIQRITTRDNIFVGFRIIDNGKEGVSLESDLTYIRK